MMARAYSSVRSVLKDRLASTSVETRPGTSFVSSMPTDTARRSATA
jgi:hypothetical protein